MADGSGELARQVAGILVERLFLSCAPEEIGLEESLTLKYGVDSVRLFDMVVSMEEDFGISFEDDELTIQNFDTIAKIVASVQAKQEAAG